MSYFSLSFFAASRGNRRLDFLTSSFRYENGDPLIRFTGAQLGEIRKATVAKIICDNSDNIDTVQRSAFDQNEPFLYVVSHHTIPNQRIVMAIINPTLENNEPQKN